VVRCPSPSSQVCETQLLQALRFGSAPPWPPLRQSARRQSSHRPQATSTSSVGTVKEVPSSTAPPSPGVEGDRRGRADDPRRTGRPAELSAPITLQQGPELRHRTAPAPALDPARRSNSASRRSAGSSIPSNSPPEFCERDRTARTFGFRERFGTAFQKAGLMQGRRTSVRPGLAMGSSG